MSILDLLKMSLSSLWRRKLRTVLTVLGVVVGTASIVVMISLGLGLSKNNMDQIEKYGGLTTIEVSGSDGGYYYGGMGMEAENNSEPIRIDDAAIEALSRIEHVEIASPVMSVYVIARQGAWEGQFSIKGMSLDALKKMNIDLAEGSLPTEGQELQLVYGNTVVTSFYNAKTQQYYWETGVIPDVDFMNSPMFIIFDTDAYYNSKWGGTDANGAPVAAPKKYIVPACGLMAGGPEDYGENSYEVLCDVNALTQQLKKVFKGKVIPGQPTNKAGKPYKELYYNSAYVRVDDMKYVSQVQDEIRALGYNTYSNIEWMEQVQEQSKSIQAALGGIGAVSLFVAAIGIANTMMMSIYERTKEIGIFKVLGCDMAAIRNMFLAEAAFIGFIGGVVGIVLSYLISFIINKAVPAESYYSNISYIPPYLVVGAMVFAVIIGMLAGLFPSLRAMRLSPLAAIRNE